MANASTKRAKVIKAAIGTLVALTGVWYLYAQSSRPKVSAEDTITPKVRAIDRETKRIDALSDAPSTPQLQQARVDLAHWQFYGTFENSVPLYLTASFSEGDSVREETYYFSGGKLILARIEHSWDVEEPAKAPEPAVTHYFYLDGNRLLRHVTRTASHPPKVRTDSSGGDGREWLKRAERVGEVFQNRTAADSIAASLEVAPEM